MSRSGLGNLDYSTSVVGALEEGLGFLDNVRQRNRIGQRLEDGQVQLACEQLPGVLAVVKRGVDRVNAGEVHVAQNERQDGGGQVWAGGHTGGGDGAAPYGTGQYIGQDVGSGGVDGAGVASLLQGLSSLGELGAVHNGVGT